MVFPEQIGSVARRLVHVMSEEAIAIGTLIAPELLNVEETIAEEVFHLPEATGPELLIVAYHHRQLQHYNHQLDNATVFLEQIGVVAHPLVHAMWVAGIAIGIPIVPEALNVEKTTVEGIFHLPEATGQDLPIVAYHHPRRLLQVLIHLSHR